MSEWTRVEGKNAGEIKLYALSTCSWCRQTKKFLTEQGIAFSHIDVDLLPEPEQDKLAAEVMKWNPAETYPTIVINDKVGFLATDQARLKKELGLK
ncbi:MAG: glutaredoxin family protein [Candidatus Margulisbacteria bacterium]|jgi:glutaredoxin|nr:glutaredoxin family protein [Candidatus Margulisiibacteriota bacterium]